jgi:hypothetical protein
VDVRRHVSQDFVAEPGDEVGAALPRADPLAGAHGQAAAKAAAATSVLGGGL